MTRMHYGPCRIYIHCCHSCKSCLPMKVMGNERHKLWICLQEIHQSHVFKMWQSCIHVISASFDFKTFNKTPVLDKSQPSFAALSLTMFFPRLLRSWIRWLSAPFASTRGNFQSHPLSFPQTKGQLPLYLTVWKDGVGVGQHGPD